MDTKHDLIVCPNIQDAKLILNKEKVELIILDLNFPSSSGIAILEHIYENKINVPVIIYSGYINEYLSQIRYFSNLGVIFKVYSKPLNFFDSIIEDIDSLLLK